MNYRFKPNDKVKIMSYCGADDGVPVVVFSCYTSDKENHCAAPHNRYVCYVEDWKGTQVQYHLHDVSENELVKQ